MIDLTTLEHEFVTMDELFAKPEIEGDPFVDPSVAFFDANEHLYVAAFQEYTVTQLFSPILSSYFFLLSILHLRVRYGGHKQGRRLHP